MTKKIYILFLLFFFSFILKAQDIHWSQFNDNPLFQNPGNSGNFDGDIRLIANYRNQWKSVTLPFSTLNLSIDLPIKKIKQLSYGAYLFHDVAGDGKFRTIELQNNFSYRFDLMKNGKNILLPGINFGINHRQVNFNLLSFDNQYNGVNFDPSLPNLEPYTTQKKTNFSIGLGTIYIHQLSDQIKITSGIGLYNLNQPDQGFYNDKIKRDIRTNFFMKGSLPLNTTIDVLPSVQLNLQGTYREIVIGGSLKYKLVETPIDYKAVYGGIWLRNKDAIYISGGLDYQNWFAGISYDINFSKLVPASNLRGGFEVALRYIIHQFKPKKITHRICPDYI